MVQDRKQIESSEEQKVLLGSNGFMEKNGKLIAKDSKVANAEKKNEAGKFSFVFQSN